MEHFTLALSKSRRLALLENSRLVYKTLAETNTLAYFSCGLYYKTVMIIIMTIISDAPNCGITYNHNCQH